MPRCDTCGFAHAQANHCINCGNPDPFRRHRLLKFGILVGSLLVMLAAGFFFYQRYRDIERSVREAESAARDPEAFYSSPATEAAP
jgi:hypothetical protein